MGTTMSTNDTSYGVAATSERELTDNAIDTFFRLKPAQHTLAVEHDPELPPQWIRVLVIVCLVTLLAGATIIGGWIVLQNGSLARTLTQLLESDPRLVLGVPWAGGASLVVVLILRSSFGMAEFKIFGVEFKGASGPTVMWVLCFLAEALVMRVL
jgi:hypothetical protein